MPNQILTMEEANLFCGSAPSDSSASNHLTLTDIKLPRIEEQYVDHTPGGSVHAIEINTVFAKLDCTFTLIGWTQQVQALIDAWALNKNQFTFYGVIRNHLDGTASRAMALITGRLGVADPQNWSRGALMHWQYTIRGILHYELSINQQPIYVWDFLTNTLQVGGVDRTAAIAGAVLKPNVTIPVNPPIPITTPTGL